MRCLHLVFAIGILAVGPVVLAQRPIAVKSAGGKCSERTTDLGGRGGSGKLAAKFIPLRTATGDLTGDGRDETVVLVRDIESGIRPDEILVYELQDKDAHLIARFPAGEQHEYVLSIKSLGSNFRIEQGSLIVDLAFRKDGKMPTHYYTVTYRWNGSEMIETERSAARPLPEHMREKG